jgi:hypothetical protein
VEKEKRWADVMEEDKAEAARARAELDEESGNGGLGYTNMKC